MNSYMGNELVTWETNGKNFSTEIEFSAQTNIKIEIFKNTFIAVE